MKAFLTIAMAAAFLLCVNAETWAAENCYQKCNRICVNKQPNCNAGCAKRCVARGH
jgi:hypothetical protein